MSNSWVDVVGPAPLFTVAYADIEAGAIPGFTISQTFLAGAEGGGRD